MAERLPEEIREQGYLDVASFAFPPATVVEGTNDPDPEGWAPAIADGLSEQLGIEFRFTIIPFADVIPGLQSGRYDLAMGDISITDERLEVVNFVYSFDAETSFLTKAGNEFSPEGPEDLCGREFGILSASASIPLVEETSEECVAAGSEPIGINTFAEFSAAVLALDSDRVEVVGNAYSPLALLAEESPDDYKVTGTLAVARSGFATPKTDEGLELAQVLSDGVNVMIENGELKAIMDEWNDGRGLIQRSEAVTSESQ